MSITETNHTHNFIKLYDGGNEIDYVFHMSDIHIRNTHRHEEYREVFEKVYKKIKGRINKLHLDGNALIVLTGDIMHAKTELSPEAINLAFHFFKNLSDLAPVILIPGNHDCNLSNKNRLDALTPIVDDIGQLSNLFYLKKSGYYQYNNILFGVSSVMDDIFVPAPKNKVEFLKNMNYENKHKIALYHGAVHGAETDVGFRMNNEELITDHFKGYDYVMLGDIHKFQFLNKDNTIAYAGSLIQQSHGESLKNHGMVLWDLIASEPEFIEIPNNYGFCTIHIVNGEMKSENIPLKSRIRFKLENTNQMQYQEILEKLEKEYEILEVVRESNMRSNIIKLHNQKSKKTGNPDDPNNPDDPDTPGDMIKHYLETKGSSPEEISKILKLHALVTKKLKTTNNLLAPGSSAPKWNILELKFTNTLSYGRNNIIDFRKFSQNKIIGIVAPNFYGKSAVLDIILFCLFDKCSRGDRRDFMNKNENKMHCSLLFRIGSQKYLIERIGIRTKNNVSVKIDVNFYMFVKNKKGKMVKKSLNGVDKNETNKKIVELIGDYNDYLSTCFCLQKDDKSYNFMDMTQLQKKEYLNEILKLNTFESCYNYIKDKLKKFGIETKFLEQKLNGIQMDKIQSELKSLKKDIKILTANRESLKVFLDENLEYIMTTTTQQPLPIYSNLKSLNLKSEADIKNAIATLKNKLGTEINTINNDECQQLYNQTTEEQRKLESELSDYSQQTNMPSLYSKVEELTKSLINLPSNLKNKTVDDLQEKYNELNNKLNKINASLEYFDKSDSNLIKKSMDELRSGLKPLRKLTDIDRSISDLEKKTKEINTQINGLMISILNQSTQTYMKKKHIDLIDATKQEFKIHLDKSLELLDNYTNGSNVENDQIIAQLRGIDHKWKDEYSEWQKEVYHTIAQKNDTLQNLTDKRRELTELSDKLLIYYQEKISQTDNSEINSHVAKMQDQLDQIIRHKTTLEEKKLLEDQIKFITQEITQLNEFNQASVFNTQIQQEISQLKTNIKDATSRENHFKIQIAKLKEKTCEYRKMLDKYSSMTTNHKKWSEQLITLEEYHYVFMMWSTKNETYHKWMKIKKEYEGEINKMEKDISHKQTQVEIYKKDLEQYLALRKEYDEKITQSNLYQLYSQIMHSNGLPYEMLKSYLPFIEENINQILHSIVSFSIEFLYKGKNSTETQKLKSTIESIEINLCHQNNKPYNVKLASGFEKFIIGLSFRMVLGQISLTSRPNFFVIDEGWSCLDMDHRNNLGQILNYIKSQFEHVIIISHLDELKNQSDYIINIDKSDGYSKIL